MNLILGKLIPMGYMLLSDVGKMSPFQVIEDESKKVASGAGLVRATGIVQIEQIVEIVGYFSGVILIMTTLFLLYFVNYQRYVSDAKQKVAYILMTVATISAYTFIADVIITIIMDAFL